MDKQKHILIYRLGSLGDTVMALPCFHHIHKAYPNARFTLLTNKPVASSAAPLEAVLGKNNFFSNTLSYPVGTRNPLLLAKLARKIDSIDIDTVVNITALRSAYADRRDKLFFRMAGVKNFVGFDNRSEDFMPRIDATGLYEWEALRLARKIESLGPVDLNDERNWDLKLSAEEETKADELLKSAPLAAKTLAVNVGTKMPVKDWGEDHWISLLKLLGEKMPDYRLVLVGVKEEEDRANACLEAWNGKGINLCGASSPRVSAALFKHADLFIGHDSGPLHLAACVGTPSVGIYSCINRPRQWFPRGENVLVFPQTKCAENGENRCTNPEGPCVKTISPEEVADKTLKYIGLK